MVAALNVTKIKALQPLVPYGNTEVTVQQPHFKAREYVRSW